MHKCMHKLINEIRKIYKCHVYFLFHCNIFPWFMKVTLILYWKLLTTSVRKSQDFPTIKSVCILKGILGKHFVLHNHYIRGLNKHHKQIILGSITIYFLNTKFSSLHTQTKFCSQNANKHKTKASLRYKCMPFTIYAKEHYSHILKM